MSTRLSLFKGACNVHIGGDLVENININQPAGDPLNKLYERVSHHAILNSGGRADNMQCHPGTREDVIQKIENWKNRKGDQTSRMMWVSGPAGAGMSAIVQTVAEAWKKRSMLAPSFFFFCADGSRNTAKPLVATLLYQLFKSLPTLKESAANLLSENPLMFEESLNKQFMRFIYAPIHTLIQQPSFNLQIPIVLLVDGLDECSDEGMQDTSD